MASATATQAPAIPSWQKEGPPTLHTPDEGVRGYLDKHLNMLSPRRRWQTQRCALNLWFYMGRQWIQSVQALAPGGGGYHFREVFRKSSATFKRPVTNMIGPAVDNEVARLSRKEYVPDTSAGRKEPEWIAAARLAKDIVSWEMGKQLWADKREQTTHNLCIDSTVGLATWWDENDYELTLVCADDPRRCPNCGTIFASARIPEQLATVGMPTPMGPIPLLHSETLVSVDIKGEQTALFPKGIPLVEMRVCPICPRPFELQDYLVSEAEAQQEDPFGRPIGMMVPRGDSAIDVLSVHEVFFENAGIGVEPHEQSRVGRAHVKPLEWIALRYPELADDLAPEEPKKLLLTHPLYSDNAFVTMREGGVTGPDVYTNHALVKELIVQPQPHIRGLERGAHFVRVGEKVHRNELCVEVGEEGHRIPRVNFQFARFKRIPRSCYARSFVDDLIPLNRRLNEIDAQDVDLRERGKPMMWTPQGVELHYRNDLEGSLQVMEFDGAGTGWTPKDGVFPGVPMTGAGYHAERQQVFVDAQLIGSAQDIELGKSPGSVKTTSGLMLLSEEAATKRGPRERSLVGMYESAFQHVLEMQHAFRKEEQTYEVMTQAGQLERKSYTGDDLMAGINVKMNARAGYDEVLYQKESTSEAIQMGLYDLSTPAAIDRALENMKLPKDVNERRTLQIMRAEMAWSDFVRSRKIPVVDPTIHDMLAWHSVLAQRWIGDDAVSIQQSAPWDTVVLQLANWEARLQQESLLDQQQKAVYGAIPRQQWAAKYAQGQRLYQEAVAATQATAEAGRDVQEKLPPGAPPVADPSMDPSQVPQVPPPPMDGFLPEDLSRRIYAVWLRMLPEFRAARLALELAKAKRAPMNKRLQQVETIDKLLQFKAVIEQCRILSMAAVQPTPGAPPGTGAPAAPGAGPGPAPGAPPAAPAEKADG